MTSRTQRVDEFVDAVLTASRVLVAVSARSLAEVEETVTVTQFRTLVVLHTRSGTNLNAVADSLGVNASTAQRTVDKLVASGLVERQPNPHNRREVQLTLTDDGATLVEQVTARRRNEIARIVRAMPAQQRAELAPALHAFADAAGEPAATSGPSMFGW